MFSTVSHAQRHRCLVSLLSCGFSNSNYKEKNLELVLAADMSKTVHAYTVLNMSEIKLLDFLTVSAVQKCEAVVTHTPNGTLCFICLIFFHVFSQQNAYSPIYCTVSALHCWKMVYYGGIDEKICSPSGRQQPFFGIICHGDFIPTHKHRLMEYTVCSFCER